jgi:hypothetical protein
MKPCLTIPLLVLICALAQPAAGQKNRYPLQKAEDIDTLFYLPPLTGILYVAEGGTKSLDPAVNDNAQATLLDVMDSLASHTKLGSAIAVTPEQQERIAGELTTLFDAARKKHTRYHELAVPPLTDSVLTASGKRYVMLVALRGTTLSKEAYLRTTRRSVISLGIGGFMIPVASVGPGGIQAPIPNPNQGLVRFAKMDVMIIDVPKHYIYFSRFSPELFKEPVNRQNIAEMYQRSLGRIFWPGNAVNY